MKTKNEPKCNCLSQELWGDTAHLVTCPRSEFYIPPKTKQTTLKNHKGINKGEGCSCGDRCVCQNGVWKCHAGHSIGECPPLQPKEEVAPTGKEGWEKSFKRGITHIIVDKLFIRNLLSTQKAELIEEIEGMRVKNKKSLLTEGYNQAIDNVISHLKTLK